MKIALLLFLILIPPVLAAPDPSDLETQAGGDMVSWGIDKWLYSAADSILGFANDVSNESAASGRSTGEMALFKLVTIKYNPLENPSVQNGIKSTAIIFIFIFIIFVFGGMTYIMIYNKFPQTGEALDFLLNRDHGFDYKEYIKTLGSVVLFLVFGLSAVWLLIQIADIVSELMTVSALDAIVTSPNSAIVYFFMAIAYLLLSIFIAIRLLVMTIISYNILVLFALWEFHIIRDVIVQIFVYFAVMIFMQPILISIATIGVITIQWLVGNSIWYQTSFILYLGLVLILVVTALVLVLGPLTVQRLIKVGTWRLLL